MSPQRRYSARPTLEVLEDRVVPYALSGLGWANTNISASFVPDGANLMGSASRLFAELNAIAPTPVWQREFARALQTWANVTPLNFHFVSDNGSPTNTWGLVQGDSRFGDIRLGTNPLPTALAATIYPSSKGSVPGLTDPGDLFLSDSRTFAIGSTYDLYTVVLHELGHALGLNHSSSGSLMYSSYAGVKTGLSSDDIAGIQAIYGSRRPDSFDARASNNVRTSATPLALSSAGAASLSADLTTLADVDYYRLVVPAGMGGSLTASVDARGLSLLAPKVTVYNALGNVVATASAGSAYGTVARATLSGVTAGQTYYVAADGATGDVFGMGAYKLNVQLGSGGQVAATTPVAPSGLTANTASGSQINLTWSNVTGETGYKVERSSGGSSWTQVVTTGAGVTRYQNTGLAAGTTYSYRVRAYNSAGNSPYSNLASARTFSVTTQALVSPATLTNLVATTSSSDQINLSWRDNSTNEAGVTIQPLSSNDRGVSIAQVGPNVIRFSDSRVNSHDTNQYRVYAFNEADNSSYSNVTQPATGLSLRGSVSLSLPVVQTLINSLPAWAVDRVFTNWEEHGC